MRPLPPERPPGQVFGAIAAEYDDARPAPSPELWPLVDRTVGGLAGLVALDLAAGTGTVTRELTARGCRVVAAEADPLQVRQLRLRSPDVPAVIATAEALPLRRKSFDLVACGTAWHWLDAAAAAVECARVLRPPGWLVLFWVNHLRDLEEPWQAAENEVYRRWDRRWGSRPAAPGGVRPDVAAADLRARGWNVRLETVLTWGRPVTLEQHLRTLGTHSVVLWLGEDRRCFLDEVAAALGPWPAFTERLHGHVVVARPPSGQPRT